jgi:hypothetical protein
MQVQPLAQAISNCNFVSAETMKTEPIEFFVRKLICHGACRYKERRLYRVVSLEQVKNGPFDYIKI